MAFSLTSNGFSISTQGRLQGLVFVGFLENIANEAEIFSVFCLEISKKTFGNWNFEDRHEDLF